MNADKQGSSVVKEDDIKQFDEQILLGLLQGDAEAWRDLFEHYKGRLDWFFNEKGVFLEQDREDLLSETIAAIFKSLPGYDPDGAPLRNWIYAIATNIALKHQKWYSEQHENEEALNLTTMSQNPENDRMLGSENVTEQYSKLNAAMNNLSEKDQEIIRLRLGREHVPWRELAPEIGIGKSAAKMRHMRAIERLKGLLEE